MSRGYLRGADRESLLSKRNDSSQFSPGQVQNVKAAKVYVFGNERVEEDEEYELEMSEIRSRKGGGASARSVAENNEPVFLERELAEGDTLQKVALQYSCPVSELKRINNLIRDQDFFALRTIKVPIKRYGFLTEIMEEEKRNARAKKYSSRINGETTLDETESLLNQDPESSADFSDPEMQMKVIRTLSIRDNINSQSREAEQFLRNMDKDLSKMKNSRTDRNSLDEVISVLTNKTFHPLERKKVELYNGADCGLSYWKVLLIIIIVCVVIPVIALYWYFHDGQS